jgi:hypothetical protein
VWFADVVLDLPWFIAREGRLGEYAARSSQDARDPDPKLEFVLYGDDEAIRHLRVMMHTDDHAVADKCSDRNINRWVSAVEVSSELTTPTFTTAAPLQKNSAAFIVILGQGQIETDACKLDMKYTKPPKADFASAAKIMSAWKPDYGIHLHYFSRFLNSTLLPEARWLNGYRLLEWHFRRGRTGLPSDKPYRDFIDTHGSGFDAHLRQGQTRYRLIEETRALAAHAIVAADSDSERRTTDLILRTFSAMEYVVSKLMNDGAGPDVEIFPKAASEANSQLIAN